MKLEPPRWWYEGALPRLAWALYPVSVAYGAIAVRRLATAPAYRGKLPVVCVGNFTMGGAGKTPVALKLAAMLRGAGYEPGFLSRGYGGREPGPHLVDPAGDDASRVGDEPLLLARSAPTVVSRVRPDGARLLETAGASVIIMDDGFQNPSMYKDFSLIVVDAAACLGNGKVFPMGPLRAPFGFQARMADAIAVLGAERTGAVSKLRSLLADAGCQPSLFEAETVPSIDGERTAGKFLAFCGIGRPAKFFETLHRANVDVAAKRAFPDHHPYTEADAASLLAEAKSKRLRLITTEKDAARLKGMPGALEELYLSAVTLPISVSFSGRDEDRLMQALLPKLSRT